MVFIAESHKKMHTHWACFNH